MSCAARHGKNVLCFECYRSRLDAPPERRLAKVTVFPNAVFPRVLTDRELAHRHRMLSHLRTFGRTAAPSHIRTIAPVLGDVS